MAVIHILIIPKSTKMNLTQILTHNFIRRWIIYEINYEKESFSNHIWTDHERFTYNDIFVSIL